MPHLRRSALAGLLLAVVPATALSACGFDYPTDRVNTISSGVNDRSGDVDALGIRVLATAQGEGRLIGSLSNNLREDASLEAVSSTAGVSAGKFAPVEVAGRGTVNLATAPAVPLTGNFTAGDVIPLDLTFSDGTTLSLDVPVVKPCFQYTQVPTEGTSESASEEGTDGAAAEAAAEEEGGEAHAEESGDATFNCADDAPSPEGEH
ncbi:hypothetical protein [Nocardioides daeguensis]|uniref:Copper chaperone PCu(A)C n=1 Tax=Nocardioides daeguensis TaxID=908359 RepID=A0ABP6V3S1_9ACTN|nr:hypothetical protein [Nocardioides daeguensis]MBV6727237.1 hypothetical protein [Nocardioides daeguensis]MCR1771251.1 hypothetical protein [Nocardioides daeguensis]